MIADNLLDNTTLTFTHNFGYIDCWWPNYDFMLLTPLGGNMDDILGRSVDMFYYNFIAGLRGWGLCYGIVLYISNIIHILYITCIF